MKVANQVPEVIKRPVYVTNDIYEIWYSQPISLGKINKRGAYWYTADHMRFASSRNAMEYLIKMASAGSPVAKLQVQKEAAVVERRAGPTHPPTTITTHKPRPIVRRPTLQPQKVAEPINQNHPMFQEFLEFQTWKAKQKAQVSGN